SAADRQSSLRGIIRIFVTLDIEKGESGASIPHDQVILAVPLRPLDHQLFCRCFKRLWQGKRVLRRQLHRTRHSTAKVFVENEDREKRIWHDAEAKRAHLGSGG